MINMADLTNLLHKLKLDNKKIFVIPLIFFVILYMDFTFLMKLQLQGIRILTPKIIQLKENTVNLDKDLSMMQGLRKKIDDKKQTGVSNIKQIISEGEMPLLLQAISDIANQDKVRIIQINTSRDTKGKEEIIAQEKLLPITVTLDLSCTYHALGGFINSLENARQFMELEDMKIMRDPRDYFLENVNLTLKTYAKR